MKKLFFLISITLLFPAESAAQRYPDNTVDSLLNRGIHYIINEKFSAAQKTFEQLDSSYPELPLGKIYLAAVEIVRAYDYGVPFNDNLIDQYLDAAFEQSEQLLEMNEVDLWYNYFAALTNAFSAYYEALNKDWIGAFDDGLTAITFFEVCLTIDKQFHESYLAIGTYRYWKNEKTNWIPFVEDDTENAVEMLARSVDNPSYNSFLSVNSLAWIYIDRDEPQKAIDLLENIINQYPNSRYFRWAQARAYEDVDLTKAIEIYHLLLKSYKDAKINSNIKSVVLMHKIAQDYYRLDNDEKALEYCEKILAIKNFTEYEKRRLADRMLRVMDLRDELKGE